ncbi:hypothetical protein [Ralstonia solanacearum]|uniref:hypothetical protein n=1 Tax=Ralstonia solanacearum TaxID=305 RepID=UPI0001816CC0|nr:hypothetical protein [Ralstonia solanacearum]MDC6179193.1 hypothetical protein [Ralstonia solanacearum]MDC6211961.1 hypothetical protein [Ralstonia solanacearum]MDC6240880.1 hypothetical protein [Ralstonia solanacearum]MDD7800851.1 hypothetical protein [Ralstonia solanacearum]
MIARTIPIAQFKPDLNDALRMAVAEIERFLAMFHPAEAIHQTHAATAIAGQWLSRIKGFHQDDDFLHLVRDFLGYVLSGGERSRLSDQLAYYFSGFMPSYGAARIFLDMVADGQPWSEVQAFMHSQSYGNARQYVETFDWAGGQKKAQAEINAWKAILREQDVKLQAAGNGAPILLAQAQPAPNTPMTDVPANDPYFPKPRPQLRVMPPPEPLPSPGAGGTAARGIARGLGVLVAEYGAIALFAVVIALVPGNAFQKNTEDEDLRKWRAEYDRKKQLAIPDTKPQADAVTDTANNECKAQIEDNKKNGAVCENDGYVLMEDAFKYKRLVDPPKGRGLDGLFEKLPALDQPQPMPTTVTSPKPGKVVFIPADKKPPRAEYDYVATALNKPAAPTYPKFVVFEAKHISKTFDPADTDGIKKEAKRRLGDTCDGLQMGSRWTVRRIPSALERQYGKKSIEARQKGSEIINGRYAKWMFVCLPGPISRNGATKLYVLIDVVVAGLKLDDALPKTRQPRITSDNSL